MTMQSVMFYFQQFCLFGSSFFSFLCQIMSGRGHGFHFLKRNTGILFQIEGSLILFDFIMSETQLFKEDYHS